ncbi:MAG: nicotinate (nicotinamide) nucleotide adenylyltransferase [Deltaproteobacteria bacterium]|nr:nicotinate (nicotinamide) nucleotide adenylyltransferase [Deltaproteobacteria bacterium]
MQKIGLFGGTFDPVHIGHLAVGRAALRQLGLDLLYFIPAALPPHKAGQLISPFARRVAMLRLAAVEEEPRFVVSEIEGLRPGPSYTVDTLSQFRQSLGPEAEFFFIIGLDAFAEITTWNRYAELLDNASFVVIDRPSHGRQSVAGVVGRCFPDYREETAGVWSGTGSHRIYSLAMEPVPVSSSLIRARLRQGESVEGLVPPKVAAYLRRNLMQEATGTRH